MVTEFFGSLHATTSSLPLASEQILESRVLDFPYFPSQSLTDTLPTAQIRTKCCSNSCAENLGKLYPNPSMKLAVHVSLTHEKKKKKKKPPIHLQ